MTEPTYLFVYGSLRRDANGNLHDLLLNQVEFINLATMTGTLYNICDYPGALYCDNTETDLVFGEVYRLYDPISLLSRLDEYEECSESFPQPHEYWRKVVPCILADRQCITAWVYLYNRPVDSLIRIVDGNFLAYKISQVIQPV